MQHEQQQRKVRPVCETVPGYFELDESLSEIKLYAKRDVKARPQIISKRFPGNLEWAKYTRKEQEHLLRMWRPKEEDRRVGETFEAPVGTRPETSKRGGGNAPTTREQSREEEGRRETAEPATDAAGNTSLSFGGTYTGETISITQSFGQHRGSQPRRTGKECSARRATRRVYDSLCLHGYTFIHLAFEANFSKEVIKEARHYYAAEKNFERCGECNSRAVNFACGSTSKTRNCYRCGFTERLETPSWLQVRPHAS